MKESTFLVRVSKEKLEKFNSVVKKNAVNRSELFRKWMDDYIKGKRNDEK